MRSRWEKLALREKRTVGLGASVVLLLLIYQIIWAPFTHHINHLRNKIQKNQALLVWMKSADQRIEEAEKSATPQEKSTPASLPTLIQNNINQSPIASTLSQLRTGENDIVQLTFQKVNFDQLIAWITSLWQENNITIQTATITKTDTPGIVSAEMGVKAN